MLINSLYITEVKFEDDPLPNEYLFYFKICR